MLKGAGIRPGIPKGPRFLTKELIRIAKHAHWYGNTIEKPEVQPLAVLMNASHESGP